jgi:hypothetical protein
MARLKPRPCKAIPTRKAKASTTGDTEDDRGNQRLINVDLFDTLTLAFGCNDFNLTGETLMFKVRLAIFLTLALSFLPATLAAQPREGEFVILSAQYGTEHHHVDVTERLRDAARHERMIRLDNRTFGVDPEKGVPKVLRIYARGPAGHEHMFEYAEGTVIDGSRFRGWDRGEWGNGGWSGRWEGEIQGADFEILSAQYGTERRHVDVTARLR